MAGNGWTRTRWWRWAAFACVLVLAGCHRPLPEQQLRATLDTLEDAIERRDAGDVRAVLADDFVGPEGLDREGAIRLAQAAFLRHASVGVAPGPLDVALKGDHATVRFGAALTGGPASGLPDAARLYDVETGWRLEDDEWRLTSATWTPRL